jgi:hypothetical protein
MPPAIEDQIDQHAPVDSLRYWGNHYASKAEATCSGRAVGHLLEKMSNKTSRELLLLVRTCCTNARAGQTAGRGYVVPTINCRAAQSMLQLAILGRRRPQQFPAYKVNITVRTADLQGLCDAVGQMGDASKSAPPPRF